MSNQLKRPLDQPASQQALKIRKLTSNNSNKMNNGGTPLRISLKPKVGTNGKPAPAKKLVIKNFKVQPKLPENFAEQSWEALKNAVEAIHKKSSVSVSLESLFQSVENMCRHKMAESLYNKLELEVDKHISSLYSPLVEKPCNNEVFLILVDTCWKEHCDQMLMIRDIFLYLDRTYVIQNPNIKSIWDLGLDLFRKHIVSIPSVEKKITAGLLSSIERERNGEDINKNLLKNLLRMLTALNVYKDTFEIPFLNDTDQFYHKEGETYVDSYEVPVYLKSVVEQRLNEENERVEFYLDPTTKYPLIQAVELRLLKNHTDIILTKGFHHLMDQNRISDLNRLYNLFGRISQQNKVKDSWNLFIKKVGTDIVNDSEKDKSLVETLLQFRQKLDVILEQAFSNNENFTYSLKEACEHFINTRQNKPAELIARYVDTKLKSGNKQESEEELENLIDKIMVLFRYIHGKDVFEAFYKKDLARRLLLDKSASIDAEKYVIQKLKTECGSSFTNKLEGMFKDIDLSRDIMNSYKLAIEEKSKDEPEDSDLLKVDLSVYVLTAGYWPAYPITEIKLPSNLANIQEFFKKFYLAKHTGRRLTFQNSLGHTVLKANFPKSRKEFSVSLFQTVVLLLFNDEKEWSYQDIRTVTGIEDKELKRTLQSLSFNRKVRLLNRKTENEESKQVEETDLFSVNNSFTSKLFRIKVNAIQLRDTTEEQKKTTESVFQDRQYQIDAAIVRIMKTRKSLQHTLLMNELYAQLKFPLKPIDLKKRIESLIDREYVLFFFLPSSFF